MKQRLSKILIVFLFIIMLIRPREVFTGAENGLLLWFQIVLPTLLPFIMISNLLVHTNAFSFITYVLGPVIKRIFHTSEKGSFAVLTGFLCGYPMGAKVTADLIRNGHISLEEGRYLLSFCNNTSLGFIMNYVVWKSLGAADLTVSAVIILLISPFLTSFLFRIYYIRKSGVRWQSEKRMPDKSNVSINFKVVDTCIMDSFEAITNVGGYIIIFSILLTLLQLLPIQASWFQILLLPSLEITNGIPMLCTGIPDFSARFITVMSLTSFGGFCAAAQTSCMIQGTGLSIAAYTIEKLVTALVTSLLCILFLLLFLN